MTLQNNEKRHFRSYSGHKDDRDSRIHSTIIFRGDAFRLPSSVSLCIPSSARHWLYLSVSIALKGLFHKTSDVWINLVHPPGIVTWSMFKYFKDAPKLLSMWHSYESHAKIFYQKRNSVELFWYTQLSKSLFI